MGMPEMKLSERITADRIALDVTWLGQGPDYLPEGSDGFDPMSDAYTVTLSRPGAPVKITIPFWMGSGLHREPTTLDVMSSMLMDASGWENADGFGDWCNDYGYDDDSRKAYATYQAIEAQTEQLRTFLGEQYHAYLWETENDD